MKEKDTSSLITTGARTFSVFDDNDDYAGSAQVFGAERAVEVAAIEAAMNPTPDTDEQDFKTLCAEMLKIGMVWCHGRCQRYRHFSEFTVDTKNTERLSCHSFCKECRAAMRVRQYHAEKPDAAHYDKRRR